MYRLAVVLPAFLGLLVLTKAQFQCDLGTTLLHPRSDETPGGRRCAQLQNSLPPESNLQRRDGAKVCAMSIADSTDTCNKVMTYPEAVDYCRSYGMRLPTYTEVRTEEVTRGLDCGSDGNGYLNTLRIWTQSPCSSTGYWVTRTTTNGNDCAATTDQYRVACVADTNIDYDGPGQQNCIPCPEHSIAGDSRRRLSNCECQYPFSTRTWGRDTFTCSASSNVPDVSTCPANDYALLGSRQTCEGNWDSPNWGDFCYKTSLYGQCPTRRELRNYKYTEAETYCLGGGARLCTALELRAANKDGECEAIMDSRWIWSQTSCGTDKVWARKRDRERCINKNTNSYKRGVRCCRDNTPRSFRCKSCGQDQTSPAGSETSEDCSCVNDRVEGRCELSPRTRPPTPNPTPRPTAACGDNKYEGGSESYCNDLDWRRFDEVQDRSRNYDNGRYKFCYEDPRQSDSFSNAKTICENQGARLCTNVELNQIFSRLQESRRYWSSTPCCEEQGNCGTDYIAVGQGPNTCKNEEGNSAVVCCADTRAVNEDRCFDCPENSGHSKARSKTIEDCECDGQFWGAPGGRCNSPTVSPTRQPTVTQMTCEADEYAFGSTRTCGELGIPLEEDNTCAADKFDDTCPSEMTYNNAKSYCAGKGMRLCRNKNEIRRNAQDLQCVTGATQAWVDRPCSDNGNRYFISNRLATGSSPNAQDTCETTSNTAAVVCCADSVNSGRCGNCPENSNSDAGSSGIDSCDCSSGYTRSSTSSIQDYCTSVCPTYTSASTCRADSNCQWFGAPLDPDDRCCGRVEDDSSVCLS